MTENPMTDEKIESDAIPDLGNEAASGANASPTEKVSARPWMVWLILNSIIGGYFIYGLLAPASSIKTSWLPGETTHGHYQIELKCNACHLDAEDDSKHTAENVMQNACIQCHGDQLKKAKDTHPSKKFNDPTNADLLLVLDAQDCLTCHQEHVPQRTETMGLTMPSDYCWHCHQDVADSRPSHEGMAFDSCATAGCHNYHDNRALYEKFLNDHHGEEDHFAIATLAKRNFADRWAESHDDLVPLTRGDADAPMQDNMDDAIFSDWEETAHANAGVNCTACHQGVPGDDQPTTWTDRVEVATCGKCHEKESESFLTGKHGMRIASGLSPMTPHQARLPMQLDSAHRELTCNSCHAGHRFDSQYASTTACQQCHADDHSLAYASSSHADLWRDETDGAGESGTGVSCATCHMPRISDGDEVWVNHDQNTNLRPNETMARQVCNQCHGLEFSLSALADENTVRDCFATSPEGRIESVQMSRDWFSMQEAKRKRRKMRSKK